MANNVFVTHSRIPPIRWQQAFPDVRVVDALPAVLVPETVVWLHNVSPEEFPSAIPHGVRFVVLHDDPTDEKGLACLAAGAAGYAHAHAMPSLLQTIESVVRNHGLWVGESLLSRLLRSLNAGITGSVQYVPLQKLSEREREVAMRIARGESNKEIARDLALSERTVKAHLSAIFDKLNVRDRLQLALLLKTSATG